MQQRVRDLFETAVEKPAAERLTWLREQTGTEVDAAAERALAGSPAPASRVFEGLYAGETAR